VIYTEECTSQIAPRAFLLQVAPQAMTRLFWAS